MCRKGCSTRRSRRVQALTTDSAVPRTLSARRGHGAPPHRLAGGSAASPGSLAFVFPYGASLTVQKPAFPVLSSGPLALPLNRPVCALWTGKARAGSSPGRMCVLGSSLMLHDDWIDKDDNAKALRGSRRTAARRPASHPGHTRAAGGRRAYALAHPCGRPRDGPV